MRRNFIQAAVLLFVLFIPVSGTIINIPDDYPNIQQGIDASVDGDTVLVQPGTYPEIINFNGNNVIVASLFLITADISHISSTVIDGGSSGTVALFESGEDEAAAIVGFTITGGNEPFGGGISCASNSNPSIMYNIIRQNFTSQGGGGISCWQNCDPVIAHNVIHDNSAQSFGGGILCSTNSNPTIINNVVSRNNSSSQGGGIMSWQSNPVVINSVFWNNEGLGNDDEIYGTVSVSYSDIEGGWSGQGNINTDPLFRDPDSGDFHLMSTACGDPYDSPCIDAGDPNVMDGLLDCSWGLGELTSDMGAYGGADLTSVGIDDYVNELPQRSMLLQNYPNPFNASTTVRYLLPAMSDVRIEIFDLLGRKVIMLVDGRQEAGYHQAIWNAEGQSSGLYFFRIGAEDFVATRSMTLLK